MSAAQLAVSMIAWPPELDAEAAVVLSALGVRQIEATPARVVKNPMEPLATELTAFRSIWEDRGFSIPAFQALLFGAPHLALFEGEELRNQLFDHLCRVFRMANAVGARKLVFGSPKNRLRRSIPIDEALFAATNFFRSVAVEAAREKVELCIEANPAVYGGDFILTTAEALELVRQVDHPGFRLHLDIGGMQLAGESPESINTVFAGSFSHLHVSEPQLAPVTDCTEAVGRAFGDAVQRSGYAQSISIEMRATSAPLEGVASAVQFVLRHYFPA